MNRTQPTRGVLLAALVVPAIIAVVLPGQVEAQRAGAGVGDLAAATVHAGGVDFLPNVAFSGARITVIGREITYQRSFAAGERLSIGMFDPDDRLLADGTYGWRLELTPTTRVARDLRRSARRNGGISPERWLAETGVFTIRNGQMVSRGLAEERPARRTAPGLGGALPAELGGGTSGAAGRIANDTDEATASGVAPRTRAADDRAVAPAGRLNSQRSDAATLAAGPAPAWQVVSDDQNTRRRSWPTDGKNGRDQ